MIFQNEYYPFIRPPVIHVRKKCRHRTMNPTMYVLKTEKTFNNHAYEIQSLKRNSEPSDDKNIPTIMGAAIRTV